MEINQFRKTSRLYLRAEAQRRAEEGGRPPYRTLLRDVSFTAPFKIMQPFHQKDGGLQVMLLAASAGIMEGDRQEFEFEVEPHARLEFISQSYDKIHQMKEGKARRVTRVRVGKEASFRFHPQPTIPFAESAYESEMKVFLEDHTSRFQMSEIFTCGRYAMGEAFAYRYYHSLVEICRGEKLIYRDNVRYEPSLFDMAGMGMYESYTHLLSMFVTCPDNPEGFLEQAREFLSGQPDLRGGITRLASGDFAVRVLGHRAQRLEECSGRLMELASCYYSQPFQN